VLATSGFLPIHPTDLNRWATGVSEILQLLPLSPTQRVRPRHSRLPQNSLVFRLLLSSDIVILTPVHLNRHQWTHIPTNCNYPVLSPDVLRTRTSRELRQREALAQSRTQC